MSTAATRVSISVIIPTWNRAALLQQALESLADQSIRQDEYELVVVDDGSSDETPEVCQAAAARLPLRYFRIAHAGTAAARNLGLFASLAPIVFFFNDDELATRNLLQHHLDGHWKYPEENSAILGYTTWAPGLPVSEVMRYILDSDRSYGQNLKNDQQVDSQVFRIGRTSCKRSLLTRRGLFQQDPQMAAHAGSELAHRLAWPNVFFRRDAVQYRNRPVTFEELFRLSVQQGRAQWAIRRLHTPMIVRTFWPDWEVNAAQPDGEGVPPFFQVHLRRIREIEAVLGKPGEAQKRPALVMDLRRLYDWTTCFFRLKGVMEGMNGELDSGPRQENAPVESELTVLTPAAAKQGNDT
jgi:glycosyltransferase involved in cell wall biosynthesis